MYALSCMCRDLPGTQDAEDAEAPGEDRAGERMLLPHCLLSDLVNCYLWNIYDFLKVSLIKRRTHFL